MNYLNARNILITACLAVTMNGHAIPVFVDFADGPLCDPLHGPGEVDELGIPGIFPPDEIIDSIDHPSDLVACPMNDTPQLNVEVEITNLTQKTFIDVWYVSDPETSLSNQDGWVNGEEAFRIDNAGMNQPLVFESLNPNGAFEPGETWIFIIDDYFNVLGIPPSAFGSPGLVGQNSVGDPISSGSIIGNIIPIPAAIWLFGSGVLGLAAVTRRRSAK